MTIDKDADMKNTIFLNQGSGNIDIMIKSFSIVFLSSDIVFVKIYRKLRRIITSLINMNDIHFLIKINPLSLIRNLIMVIFDRSLLHQIDIFYRDIIFMNIFEIKISKLTIIIDQLILILIHESIKLIMLIV